MKKYGRYILAFLFVVLIGQIVLFSPQRVDREVEDKTEAPMPADVEQSMQGVHLIETSQGKKEWELWADKAVSLKDKDSWSLEKVKATFFGDNGVEFNVVGKTGSVDTKTKDMTVDGDVVTRSSNGYVFRTESVVYQSSTRYLESPGAVEMQGPKDDNGHAMTLKGGKLNAALNDAQIHILNDVRAEKTVKGNKRMTIHSQDSEFSGKQNMAKFRGNVVIDMDSMRITGPEADFKFDPTTDSLKAVDVQGGVKVSDLNKWATSDNVRVLFDEDKYVFQGNPKVVQNDDVLRGEEIIFLDGGKRVKVNKVRARVDEKRLNGDK